MASVFAQPAKILVRPKQSSIPSTALSFGSRPNDFVKKYQFNRKSDLDNFVEAIDPETHEWEYVAPISADDVVINPPVPDGGGDPLSGNQWSLFSDQVTIDTYGAVDIDAARAWTVTKGSSEVVIYVMDSGIDVRDPDLAGRITSGFDALNPGSAPVDENSHGTHVSSILGARGENNYGITGVVPGAIQIADGRFLNSDNQGDSERALAVVNWMEQDMEERRAQNPNVRFIGSNSWGGSVKSTFLEEAMQRLSAYDYLPITSAGNHGGNNDEVGYYPCNFALYANTCVAASDRFDLKASFSAYGPQTVHLFAPGYQIYGIIPGTQTSSGYSSKYQVKQGTSQAVPHVSGAAALVWAANPNLSAAEVRQILVESVDRLTGAEDEVIAGGRLNAYRAVLIATNQDPSKADRKLAATEGGGGGGCSLQTREVSSPILAILLVISALAMLAFYRRSSMNSVSSPSRSARSA